MYFIWHGLRVVDIFSPFRVLRANLFLCIFTMSTTAWVAAPRFALAGAQKDFNMHRNEASVEPFSGYGARNDVNEIEGSCAEDDVNLSDNLGDNWTVQWRIVKIARCCLNAPAVYLYLHCVHYVHITHPCIPQFMEEKQLLRLLLWRNSLRWVAWKEGKPRFKCRSTELGGPLVVSCSLPISQHTRFLTSFATLFMFKGPRTLIWIFDFLFLWKVLYCCYLSMYCIF